MDLLRVPLLLATAASYVIGTTSPMPPPRPEERRRAEGLSAQLRLVEMLTNERVPMIKRIIVCAFCAIECTFVIAHHFQNTFLLSVLCGEHAATAHPALSRPFLAAVAVAVLGGLLRLWTFRALGVFFTFELSIKDKHKLVTSGPYAVVRHPSYVAVMLLNFGTTAVAAAPGSWWAAAHAGQSTPGRLVAAFWLLSLVYTSSLLWRAPKEDEMLRKAFGREWDAYAKRVPYWYIPGLI